MTHSQVVTAMPVIRRHLRQDSDVYDASDFIWMGGTTQRLVFNI